ncbi:hypothetical protein M434DRAFT_28472 [Hypoxylon sp. CO27-5]|nr:hypothetical protein M434DRAFT_28472 [Hypoxylon sp. CO27-5]
MGYYRILLLSCLWVASLVTADPFSVDKCPIFYFRRSTSDSDPVKAEFLATCLDNSRGYRTSSLNLDLCFTNQNGRLLQSNTDVPHPGPFSPSCWNCGISLQGPMNSDHTGFSVHLHCSCEFEVHEDPHSQTEIPLEPAIFVDNGILGCFQNGGGAYNGVEIHPGPDVHVPMPPPPTTTTLTTTTTHIFTSTVTPTALQQHPTTLVTTMITTATQNNTIISTDTVTTGVAVVSTAISTDVTTAVTTESPTTVTVTKTPKKAKPKTKTNTLTETQSVTQTVYITSPSTVVVTVTPTHSKVIFASITDSHFALFSTSELPEK